LEQFDREQENTRGNDVEVRIHTEMSSLRLTERPFLGFQDGELQRVPGRPSMLIYPNYQGSIYDKEVSQGGALTEEELPVRTKLASSMELQWHSNYIHTEYNDRASQWSGDGAEDNPRVAKQQKRLFERPVKDDTVHIHRRGVGDSGLTGRRST
jgi:hypothetical protein